MTQDELEALVDELGLVSVVSLLAQEEISLRLQAHPDFHSWYFLVFYHL
jgi:hypothetical protein